MFCCVILSSRPEHNASIINDLLVLFLFLYTSVKNKYVFILLHLSIVCLFTSFSLADRPETPLQRERADTRTHARTPPSTHAHTHTLCFSLPDPSTAPIHANSRSANLVFLNTHSLVLVLIKYSFADTDKNNICFLVLESRD